MLGKLHSALHQITPNEKLTNMDAYYSHVEQVEINGQSVYLFDHLISHEANFKVTKHDRYIPVPTHIHTFIELNYLYEGSCTQFIDGKSVTLHPGDLCIIDTGVPHSIANTRENDILINILIKKSYFSANFFHNLTSDEIIYNFLLQAISESKEHNQYVIFHCQKNPQIRDIINNVLWEKYFPNLKSTQITDNYLKILFIEIMRVFQYDTNHNTSTQNLKFQNTIKILEYIEENFNHCTLQELSKKFHYSPTYLSYLIKKTTDQTYSQLIKKYRLNEVCFLLKTTQTPIDTIARKCNFNNLTYFYKSFHADFNMSPNEYRAQNTPNRPSSI